MSDLKSPSIVVYADYGSQPSRAVLAFCRITKIPHKFEKVLIFKAHQRTPQYLKKNPNAKVPTIKDLRPEANGFVLFESHAILRYLSDSFLVDDHWYPRSNIETRTHINQYLDGHHTNLRRGGELIFLNLFFPIIVGPEKAAKLVKKSYLQEIENKLEDSLKIIEQRLLGDEMRIFTAKKRGQYNWIAHVGSKPSIADLSAVCEIYQYHYIPQKFEHIMQNFPRIKKWYQRMFKIPEVQEVHQFVGKNIEKLHKMVEKNKTEAAPKL